MTTGEATVHFKTKWWLAAIPSVISDLESITLQKEQRAALKTFL